MADPTHSTDRPLRPDKKSDEPAPLLDVWSRSGSRYRVRAIVLLGVNVLLFAGLACFAFWVRSGVGFALNAVKECARISTYAGESSTAHQQVSRGGST